MDEKVTISLMEYTVLIRLSEKIEAVERFLSQTDYPTIADITAILGIEKEKENETV